MRLNTKLIRQNKANLFFCCQIATLGLLRQTPSYSASEALIADYPVWSLWLARVASLAMLALIFLVLGRRRGLLLSRPAVVLAGVGLLAGSVLTLFAADGLAVYAAAQLCVGVAHAWILACWALRLARLGAASRNWSIAASGLLAVVLFLAMGVMALPARPFGFLAIAVGSFAPLLVGGGRSGSDVAVALPSEEKPALSPSFWRTSAQALKLLPAELIVLMATYSMLFRLLTFLELPVSPGVPLTAATAVLRVAGMAVLLAYLSRKGFAPGVRELFVPLLSLTVVGLSLLPVPGPLFAVAAVSMVEASWTFFYVFMWLVLFEIGRARGVDPFLTFLGGWIVMNALLLAAAPLAWLLETQVSQGALSLTALALVLAYTFSVALLLLRNRWKGHSGDGLRPMDGEGAASSDAEGWRRGQEAFYQSMAERRGLTRREAEVFELLAQGYSLPAIEERFVLSHSTVKGHARNIYRKFDVASKQELIAAVDAELRERAGSLERPA